MIAAPVLRPAAGYTVSVGRETPVTTVHGRPATGVSARVSVSGPLGGCDPGGEPGQRGVCTRPSGGSHAWVGGRAAQAATASEATAIDGFIARSVAVTRARVHGVSPRHVAQ